MVVFKATNNILYRTVAFSSLHVSCVSCLDSILDLKEILLVRKSMQKAGTKSGGGGVVGGVGAGSKAYLCM